MVSNQDQKMATPDLSLQQHPEGEKTAGGLGGSLETDCPSNIRSYRDVVARRKNDIAHLVLRLLCMTSSAMALSFMVMAHEASTVVLYVSQILVQSEWSYASSFKYLYGAVAVVASRSLLQLLVSVSGVLRKSSIVPSRNFGWFLFAADHVALSIAFTFLSCILLATSSVLDDIWPSNQLIVVIGKALG